MQTQAEEDTVVTVAVDRDGFMESFFRKVVIPATSRIVCVYVRVCVRVWQ